MPYGTNILPKYSKNISEDAHFVELRKKVTQVVESLVDKKAWIPKCKAIVLPVVFYAIYVTALFQTQFLFFCFAYIFLGLMLVIIFLNLIHEASHNTLFKNNKYNRRYLILFDILGSNSYMWRKRHVRLHHHFTNIAGWDSDIEKSKFLKVHPKDKDKPARHYQHYLIILYPFFIFNWFLIRDFKDFFSSKALVRRLGKIPLIEYLKLFFFKIFFIVYIIIIPSMVTPFIWWQVTMALFIMLLSAGVFALLVLLPPHVNTANQFPITNQQLKIKQSWLLHQLNTTNDVSSYNWFSEHIMANFNYHIAHHLFPNISYLYAKEITEVIKNYCKEAELPYKSFPLFHSIRKHYQLIKSNGKYTNILEEDL